MLRDCQHSLARDIASAQDVFQKRKDVVHPLRPTERNDDQSVDVIRERGIPFQDTPDTYYELLPERIKGHNENIAELEKRHILMDGAPTEGQGLLLQIFTQNVIGPIFFEIIQRKGNEGFGEGNFKALFESIELDQMRRGVI